MATYCFSLDDLEYLFTLAAEHVHTPAELTAMVMLGSTPNGHIADFSCSPNKAG